MPMRIDMTRAAPKALEAVLRLEDYVKNSGLDPRLYELVKIRASQINGCAFCLHMHTRDARAAGETPERLDLIATWRDSPLYSRRERAALAWTETLTRVSENPVRDDVYATLREEFDEEETVHLSLLIAMINVWNRLAIGFAMVHPVET